jgi:DNA-binding winged helix-turn-helix (wHTH) protein
MLSPTQRPWWMRLGISALLAAAFAIAACLAVHDVLRSRADDYRKRCVNYASTVAQTVPTWANPGEEPDLGPLAKYAVMAGFLYIQVVSGDVTLLEACGFAEAAGLLAGPARSPLPSATLQVYAGRQIIDVAVFYAAPLPRTGNTPLGMYAAGRLRLGLDASELVWAAANTRALAAGLAAVTWIASTFGILLLVRVRHPVPQLQPPAPAPEVESAGARATRAGDLTLRVDEARLEAAGSSIRLTPKQLGLLKVLMSDPGRTFSDEEILARAWPDSAYADSKDVKQYVYLIRQRLNSAGLPGDHILINIPGIGYRIAPTVAEGPIDPSVDPSAVEARPDDSQ